MQHTGLAGSSVVVLERDSTADPSAADAWMERARAHQARRELHAARAAYARAADLGASSPWLDIGRSIVASQLGDNSDALAYAHAAVAAFPNSVVAQINAAVLEGPLVSYEATISSLDAVASRAPSASGLHGVRAYALLKLARYDDAVAAARQAILDTPRDSSAHEVLALALKKLDRDDEAIAALRRPEVLALDAHLHVILAIVLTENGQRDEARMTLRAALERDPTLVHAWYTLADIDDLDAAGDDVAAMQGLLGREMSAHDRILLHFALGKALLARGEHTQAFEHFRCGNAAKRASLEYDVAEDERAMADIAREFSAEVMASGLPDANMSERPVFVVGMPRSGTSLIEQLLASHRDVFGAGELPTMGLIGAKRATVERAAWPSLAAEYLATAEARAGDASRIVDKLPLNFCNVGLIRMLFPNARIIHCRRDAVENGLSCYMTNFDEGHQFSYDLTEIGRFARGYRELMAHWRAALAPERYLEVDYEAVVDDVETEARRLVAFCGLPWDAGVLRFYETRRAVRTASKMQVRKPIYRTSRDRTAAFGSLLDPLREALQ